MGCFSRRCECISWAKKELSSSEERPNVVQGTYVALTEFLTGYYTPGSCSTENWNLPVFPCFGETRAWCVVCVANFVGEASPPSQSG